MGVVNARTYLTPFDVGVPGIPNSAFIKVLRRDGAIVATDTIYIAERVDIASGYYSAYYTPSNTGWDEIVISYVGNIVSIQTDRVYTNAECERHDPSLPLYYYDRYTPDKKWDKLLFLPRVLQASELNEIQSVIEEKLKRFGDVFMSDGSVIKGCDIITPTTYPGTLLVASGYVYVHGKILTVDEQNVGGSFSGLGVEYVYMDTTTTIITENEDPTLRDPVMGEPNYLYGGSHRQVVNVSFSNETYKSATSIVFGYILDGKVIFKFPTFGADKAVRVMEQRTYDVSGNFIVNGANLKVQHNATDDSKYDMVIEPYNAYLNGKEYVSTVSQLVSQDKAVEMVTDQVLLPISSAVGSTLGLINNVFTLSRFFVNKIYTCSYPVEETFTVTHAVAGGTDPIGIAGTLIDIVSVYDGSTTYILTTDYLVDDFDRAIEWSPGGAEPLVGHTYNVDCRYYKTVSIGSGDYDTSKYRGVYLYESVGDYSLMNLEIRDAHYYSANPALIVNPEYTCWKYRLDAICLNTLTGLVETLQSDYSVTPNAPYPKITAEHFLLYLINPKPGTLPSPLTYSIDDRRTFRITQYGLRTLDRQLRGIQEGLSLSKIDDDAAKMPVPGSVAGIYTDTFETQDRGDLEYDGSNSLFPDVFDAGFNDGALVLPLILNTSNMDPTVGTNNLKTNASFYTLPFTEALFLSQSLATGCISVNPYALPYAEATLTINPVKDIWTDTQNLDVVTEKISNTISKKVAVTGTLASHSGTSELHIGDHAVKIGAGTENVFGVQDLANLLRVPYAALLKLGKHGFILGKEIFYGSPTVGTIDTSDSGTTTTLNLLGIDTTSKVEKYARQITVHIIGKNWYVEGSPSSYILIGAMSGQPIPELGTTINLESDYSFEGDFTVPANVPSGVCPVQVSTNPTSITASTNYFAQGTMVINTRQLREVTTTTKTVYDINISWVDPLAETIMFDQDFFISSIGLFFCSKDTTKGVTCSIVETVNGYPSQKTLASKWLPPTMVNTSDNSSVETLFTFDDPVYIPKNTEYAFVIKSPSNLYTVWYAKQGRTDILTGSTVVSQPYQGVMFESQNASTWTAIQDSDLKFNIYRAVFNPLIADMIFNAQTIDDSWLFVGADMHEYSNTDCNFYYNTDAAGWVKITTGQKEKIKDTGLASTNTVKAVMMSPNDMVSPILNKSVGTMYFKHKPEGNYYSPDIDFKVNNQFDHVKIRLSAYPNNIPFAVNIIASVDGGTWYKYESGGLRCTLTVTDNSQGLGIYLYEYVFDMSDNFNGINMARYAKFNVYMGDPAYSGNDTPVLFDLRCVVYESV
jgi:hypothetical protein